MHDITAKVGNNILSPQNSNSSKRLHCYYLLHDTQTQSWVYVRMK
jgi:hypothetical protein